MRPGRALEAQDIPVSKPTPVARFLAVDGHPSLNRWVLEHEPRLLLEKAPIHLNFVKQRNSRGSLVKRNGDISSLPLSAASSVISSQRSGRRPGASDQGKLSQGLSGVSAAAAAPELSRCGLLGFKWL
jgi:hypothetical protein